MRIQNIIEIIILCSNVNMGFSLTVVNEIKTHDCYLTLNYALFCMFKEQHTKNNILKKDAN